jgi:hypothetical protein
VWDGLPEHTKQAIVAIIQHQLKSKKQQKGG